MREALRGQSMKDSPHATCLTKGTVLHGLSPQSWAMGERMHFEQQACSAHVSAQVLGGPQPQIRTYVRATDAEAVGPEVRSPLYLVPLLLAFTLATEADLVAAEHTVVRPWGKAGTYGGIEVATERLVARVTFGPVQCANARKLATSGSLRATLRFTGFRSEAGVEFGDQSFLEVGWDTLLGRHELRWRLVVTSFDRLKWEESVGPVPFHFMRLHLQDASLFHIGGWHIPTPTLDSYPMHNNAMGYGRQIASLWSSNWTLAAPLPALPLATAGLWCPKTGRYVAFDFSAARLKGQEPKDVAASGVWQNAQPSVALVFPAPAPYHVLRYPGATTPLAIEGQCHLVIDDHLGSADDPNRLIHEYLWNRLGDGLAPVAPSIDVSWLPEPLQFQQFRKADPAPVCQRTHEPRSFRAGSLVFSRSPPFAVTDAKALRALTEQVSTRVVDGDTCCSWRDPLEGDRTAMFGSGSVSDHTDANWLAGQFLLEAVRRDVAPAGRLLPAIDGVLRFTKHMAYTRASRPDVPACQSARAIAAGVRFCLAYHHLFGDDASRRDLAKLALRLARTLAYRYLTVWPCDNDASDRIDPSFMLQGNGGLSWLGTAGGEETWRLVAPVIEAYVATGDPVLGQYARGMVDRLSQLLTPDGEILCVAVADGAPVDRATWRPESIVGDLEQLIWPVGRAALRVIVGQKGVLVFHKGTHTIRMDAYRHGPDGFAFRLGDMADEPRTSPFDIAVTHPYWELHGKTARRVRAQQSDQPECTVFAERPDTVYIRGVRVGDEIIIGDVPKDAPIIASAPIKVQEGGTQRSGLASVLRPPTPPKAKLSKLEPLMKRFSGQIAVLPDPTRPDPLASRVGSMLRRVGLDEYLSPLSPQQLIDPAYFSAKTFPIAMYLGNERYHQTVKQEGDGDRALVQFLRDGGILLVLPTGTWAFYQNQAGKTIINCHTFGFCTGGHGPGELGPHAAGAVTGGFERPPKGHTLTFHVRPNQQIVKSLPSTFPYPRPGTVDLRWRPTVDKLPTPRKYTPLLTLRDETGRSWSEGAALIELSEPPFQNARVLSVWFSLLRMRGIGDSLLHDVLRYVLTTTEPVGPPRRRAALPFADDFSAHKDGEAPGPPWKLLAGKWRVERGTLVGEDCPCQGYEAAGVFCGSSRWRDYELSLRFKVESKGRDWKDGPWIGVRTNAQHDGYHLNFTHRGVQLHKVTYGVSTNERRPLAQAGWTHDDKWHSLTVRAIANRIRVHVDDQLLFDYRDDMALDFPSLREGGISLSARKWPRFRGRVTVRFDDVKVTPVP